MKEGGLQSAGVIMRRPHLSLGISLSHDASAAVCVDGEPAVAIASERLCRRKHGFPPVKRYHFELPWDAICYCLDAVGAGLDDCCRIVLNKAGGTWDWRIEDLRRTIPVKDKNKLVCLNSHHYAHALYSYCASGFREAVVLVADRFGSFVPGRGYEAETGYIVRNGTWERVFANYLPLPAEPYGQFIAEHSLTALYQIVTLHYGFYREMDQCGKTMGLAPYGKRLHPPGTWVRLDGDFSLDCSRFYEEMLAQGAIRADPIPPAGFSIHMASRVARRDYRQVTPDFACQIQAEVEQAACELVQRLVGRSGIRSVCVAGGLFHNSALNGRLLELPCVERLFVPPAVSDDGNALACAYYGCLLDEVVCRPLLHPFLGRDYSADEMEASLRRAGLDYRRLAEDELLESAAAALESGDVLGWFQGRGEFGFRALGHRSILADPRDPGIRDYLNRHVKHREPFRPLAATVLEEEAGAWFAPAVACPFMTAVSRSLRPQAVPGVTHVDQSCRIHTVNKGEGLMYRLVKRFGQRTGVPLLLNTSFNDRGEPIVETPDDALKSFRAMRLDRLALGPFWVEKEKGSAGR